MRRGPKSTTGRPWAAVTTRAALEARTVCRCTLVHHEGLDELGLGDRRRDLQDRLVLENGRALGHGIHIAGEAEFSQPVEEALVEPAQRSEGVEALAREAKAFKVLKDIVEAAGEKVVAPFGEAAHEEAEGRRLGHTPLDVGLQHGELVQISEQAEIGVVDPELRGCHRHLLRHVGTSALPYRWLRALSSPARSNIAG
jgi:hypothetical protein